MQTRPTIPSLGRLFASAPTLDTERQTPFGVTRNWNPSHIEIFGHSIDIDIPTGNLLISTSEVAYPYYNFSLGINRKYDVQEQHMQLSYLRNYPNINPKPHWFGNWQFAYESDVDEVWYNTYPELHVTSGVEANGLFEIKRPDFIINLKNGGLIDELLRTYGVPRRTLAELGWKFTENDFLLRTLRGPFQILSGHFQEETLVDNINTEMWLLNPISGTAFHVTSEFFYNIPGNRYRDVGYPLIVTKLVDALGHAIELKPSDAAPPFRKYVLSDGSGREFHIELDEELTFLDGLNPGGEVRKYLISKVTDGTKANYNEFNYKYNAKHLLEKVSFPSSIGNRYIRYYYEDPNHPGVLTAIENSHGNKIQFVYIEDPTDNDERLNPRLKIKKVTDPKGITFEYEYDHINSEVTVTISKNGNIDRKVKYTYIRDINNTKQRYISSTEIEVKRGYVTDSAGNVVSRQPNNPQIIRNRTLYTNDGRFNVEKEIDTLNRIIRYKYNDFNQVEKVWDFDNHLTKYNYDIDNPSPANPRRYDLLSVERENIIRSVDPMNPMYFVERVKDIKREFKYDKYDSNNSPDNSDHGKQSTHRIYKETDERRKIWEYTYDDPANHNPLSPTLIKSPLGIKTQSTYNDRGERETITDPETNLHTYKYNDQGRLKEYIDPNQEKITLTYYPCGNWLHKFEDQLTKITEFAREEDGKIKKIIDPVQDAVDYNYYKNGRLFKIINHRPAVPQDPADPSSLIREFPNLETEFRYSPLGSMTYMKNPKGLELLFEYDEAGQMYCWYHNVPNPKPIKFIYDVAGQLKQLVDRKGRSTVYTYFNSGFVESVRYPDWYDGTNDIPGKLVKYKKYDYLGRVLSIEDSEIPGSKEFMYDKVGNIVMRRGPNNLELSFTYDDDNRLWYLKDSSGMYELTLNLDDLGRPKSLQDSRALDGSLLWKFKYKKQVGSVTKVLNLFERSLPQIGLISNFDYDKKNHLKSIEHVWSSTPPTSIHSQVFNYRDDDLIESITGNDANSFRYDGTKQIIYEHVRNLSSDYDEAGNRIYRENRMAVPSPPINIYNDLNQLRKEKGIPIDFTYDENGNMLTSTFPVNPSEFYFDGSNCLRLIKNNQYEISYLYDIDGKLVERTSKDIATGTIEKNHFSYLLSKPIMVKRNGNPFMVLTWSPGGKLLRIRRQQAVGVRTYPHSLFLLEDGLGNITRFVDSDRTERVKIAYDPHGTILNLTDPAALFEFWGYKGGFFDRQSENVLFGARWYSTRVGRWISEDPSYNSSPSGYRDLSNLYTYSYNNPIAFVDLSGLQPNDITLSQLGMGFTAGDILLGVTKTGTTPIGIGLSIGGLFFSVLGFASAGHSETYKTVGVVGTAGSTVLSAYAVIVGSGGFLSVLSVGIGTYGLTTFALKTTPLGETRIGSGHYGLDLCFGNLHCASYLMDLEAGPPLYYEIGEKERLLWKYKRTTVYAGDKNITNESIP